MTEKDATSEYQSLKSALDQPSPPVKGLIKIGCKENLELLTQGKLRFRSLSFYKEMENKEQPFFDQYEGLHSILQAKEMYVELRSPTLGTRRFDDSNGLVGQIMISINRSSPTFCMYALHLGEWAFKKIHENDIDAVRRDAALHSEIGKFGDHVWVILNSTQFMDRLKVACQREQIGILGKLVKYVDSSLVHGDVPEELNGFVKTSTYSNEREFRFIVQTSRQLPDPFILDLGDLSDISTVMSLEEFAKSMTFTFK